VGARGYGVLEIIYKNFFELQLNLKLSGGGDGDFGFARGAGSCSEKFMKIF
jgi:hypothetical protein